MDGSHHVARLCNVGSSPSLSWLVFERRGGGGRCQKQPRAYTCTETEQKGCTCNTRQSMSAVPSSWQDARRNMPNDLFPFHQSSTSLSSPLVPSDPGRLVLAIACHWLTVLCSFTSCANLRQFALASSLSLCCFLVPIRHWLLSLSAFPGQQLETKRSNPRDFARGCFFERISRRIWVGKLLEVCGVRVVEGGMEDVGTSFDYKIVYITFYSVVVEYISKYYEM